MSLPDVKAKYLARAIGCSFGESKNGNYQIAIQCEVSDGEYTGEHIAWIGTFAPGKATDIAIRALKEAFGWKGDDLSELADLDAEHAAQTLPDAVELDCDMEEWEGEWKLKAKWANRPGGGRFAFKEPLAGEKLKAFAAQMRGTIRGMGGTQRANGPRSAPPGRANRPGDRDNIPPPADDDLPF